jgi:type IV pilus assembly protein PilA
MLSTIKQRLERDDEQGFTLIELMVVVLIIAILLAIAIPTFLGARNTANARAAQSSLRNALTAEQTYYTNNNQQFGSTTTTPSITTIEPNLTWVAAVANLTDPNDVLATVENGASANSDVVWLQAVGKDGNCYTVVQTNDSAATGLTTGYSEVTGGSAACPAPSATFPTIATGPAPGATATSGGSFYQAW